MWGLFREMGDQAARKLRLDAPGFISFGLDQSWLGLLQLCAPYR
jgi:hypothetical protein